LSLQPLAALPSGGNALRGNGADLEQRHVMGGRLVLPDGSGDFHAWRPRFSTAGVGGVSAYRRQRRRYVGAWSGVCRGIDFDAQGVVRAAGETLAYDPVDDSDAPGVVRPC